MYYQSYCNRIITRRARKQEVVCGLLVLVMVVHKIIVIDRAASCRYDQGSLNPEMLNVMEANCRCW